MLRRAKELGDYLIVGVTNDSFDRERGKLNVRNNVLERVEAVKATGYADKKLRFRIRKSVICYLINKNVRPFISDFIETIFIDIAHILQFMTCITSKKKISRWMLMRWWSKYE